MERIANYAAKKNRCIRLEYADGRKFYLDVTPAVPDWVQNSLLYVPDRERKIWCSSHPVGFCDGWFKIACEKLPTIRRPQPLFANRASDYVMANARAVVEPMPEHGAFEKMPLQRIVQMLKGDRNEYFQNDEAHRPSSILLTTITTHSYLHVVNEPVADLLEFVVKVVAKLPEYIHTTGTVGYRKFTVTNPVNPSENFAESWTEAHHQHFLTWHGRFANVLQKLHQSRGHGLGTDEMLKSLSATFGNDRVARATKALGAEINKLQETGKLRAVGGTLGAAGVAIPKTIYFGGEK